MSALTGPQPDRVAGTDEGMLESLERSGRPGRLGSRLRWLLLGDRSEPRLGRVGLYELPVAERDDIGVCCSGGGIRSAAFNLGALQTLQKRRVLQTSKYLAAVSGGSYIAAAFCMVAKTWDPAKGGPAQDDSDPGLVDDDAPPFHAGSPEEQYLRNHLGYLAPDGLARLHLGLRMLAGLVVNVLLIGVPVLIVGLFVGWAARTHYGDLEVDLSVCGKSGQPACDYAAVIPDPVLFAVGGLAVLSCGFAVLGVIWRPRRDWMRIFIETWEVRCFLFALVGAIVLIVAPWLTAMALEFRRVSVHEAALGSGATAFSSLAALAAAALAHVRGQLRDHEKSMAGVTKKLGKYAKRVRELVVAVVVMLAGPLLLVAICVLGVLLAVITSPATATDVIDAGPLGALTPGFLIWLGGSAVLLGAMYGIVDLTSVSLHPFYRRRLATAFALKRVWVKPDGRLGRAPKRGKTSPGRAEARERRFDNIVELSASGVEPGCCPIKSWPMLVLCAAANVSDPGATPPGRGVGSFTFSPKAIGGPITGAAETRLYEQDLARNRRRDITLPAAVAMSGAALAPSMGKLTYRPLTFLLALANIRLGVWVPSPAHVSHRHAKGALGKKRQSTLSPVPLNPLRRPWERTSLRHRPRPVYLWKEILGRNRLEDKFLYVTDGGHYENLGLVELLRRGCRSIYCFDAGGGTSSRALGDAIALARSELNVDIEMLAEAAELVEDPKSHRSVRACARGRIVYPPGPDGKSVEGTLFYSRSVISEDAGWELKTYQEVDGVFPHHSTFDQFFDDQKFEAYRVLGAQVAERALRLDRLHDAGSGGGGANGETALPLQIPGPGGTTTAVVAYVRQHPGTTVDALLADLPVENIYGVLGPLVSRGAIVRTGSGSAAKLRPS